MGMFEAVKSVFSQYGSFKGRARRSEYWKFYLFNILLSVLVMAVATAVSTSSDKPEILAGAGSVLGLYSLICLIPSLALSCRRLHDIGKSGSYLFFIFLPVVGAILLWVWAFQDGEPYANIYGPDPKGRSYSGYGSSVSAGSGYGSTGSDRSGHGGKVCPHCGKPVDDSSAFCAFCGRSLSSDSGTKGNICPFCESIVPDDAVYCPGCGNAVRSVSGGSGSTSGSASGSTSGSASGSGSGSGSSYSYSSSGSGSSGSGWNVPGDSDLS